MKVSVLMPTYNHGPYISKAIASFLDQKCDFQTELLIGDDASTDGTLAIANEFAARFPERIKIIAHSSNRGLMRNYQSLLEVAKGQYQAILESDDYWIDELKLQKQVDFLDAHPQYGLSFTRWKRLRGDELTLREDATEVLEKHNEGLYERFLLRNIIKSPTVVFRKSLFDKYCDMDEFVRLDFITFDFPVWLAIIRHSKIHYLNEATAVYRNVPSSISNNKDLHKRLQFEHGVEKIRRYLIAQYGSGHLSMHEIDNRENLVNARHAFRCKKPLTALGMLVSGYVRNTLQYSISTEKPEKRTLGTLTPAQK